MKSDVPWRPINTLNAAELMREISALRVELDRTRPIYEAAKVWRVGRDRDIVGTAPAGGQRSATGRALIDAIDVAIATEAKETA